MTAYLTQGAAPSSHSIAVQHVTKIFDAVDRHNGEVVYALKDLSIEFFGGEFTSIVGPSGCGKSTLLNLIAGLPPHFPVDAGNITLDGKVIRGAAAERGMVFQEYAIFPWLTVSANIEYPLKLAAVPTGERRERARYYVSIMGLEGFEQAYPHQLSGGMKQRVAVARALVSKPKVLLMDEPFAAVDAQTRLRMQEELLRVWEKERTTVIFVTHSVQEAIFLSDRVVVMTGRPGEIRAEIKVRLPRPRQWRTTESDAHFIALQQQVTDLVMTGARVS